MTQHERPPARWAWPILWLRQMVRAHEHYSVMLVIAAHVVMNVLEVFGRAEYNLENHEYSDLLIPIVNSPLWMIFSVVIMVWLMIFRHPPKVVWGLWASAGMFASWGAMNLVIGISAIPPVSLAGPALMFFVIAPLAWLAADAFEERIVQEESSKDLRTIRDITPGV